MFLAPTLLALSLALTPTAQSATLTVGATLLLANRPLAETRAALEQALRSTEARVRLVAARVLAVRGDSGAAQALAAALAIEKDAATGAEMIRALLLLRGAAAAPEASRHAARLGGPAFAAYFAWVAREQPQNAASILAAAPAETAMASQALIGAMSLAASDPKLVPAILRAWMRIAPPRGWSMALERVPASDDPTPLEPLLVDGLQSTNQWIREETIWFMLDSGARGERIPPAFVSAASARSPGAVSSWEDFGRELIARQTGKRQSVDSAQFLASQQSVDRLRTALRLKLLTPAEEEAIASRRPNADTPQEERFSPRDFTPARTTELWMEGLLDEAARSANCALSSSASYGIARVMFNADGRPREVDLDVTRTPKACIPLLQALALTDLADEDRIVQRNRPQSLVLPLGGQFAACARAVQSAVPPTPMPDRLTPQAIDVSVPPLSYELQHAKSRPGDVTAELTVSGRGCVSGVRVLKGSGMEMADVFYIRALSEWSFVPVVINGAPASFTFRTKQGFKWKSR